jgi:hypothetical protein
VCASLTRTPVELQTPGCQGQIERENHCVERESVRQ